MICSNCQVAKGFAGYRLFNPACLYCGVRVIQFLGGLPISESECKRRRRDMLSVWLGQGHDEQQIRSLVKGPPCIGPGVATVSELPMLEKPRSHGVK